jgi:hypothetical protein
MGFDFNTALMPYGDTWRTSRRRIHAHLHQGVAPKYHPTQILSARKLAREILVAKQDVNALSHVVGTNFGRMMIKMMYGIDTEEAARKHLSLAEKILDAFSVGVTPGHFLVDFLTFCGHCFSLCFAHMIIVRDSEICPHVGPRSRFQALCARDTSQPPSLA